MENSMNWLILAVVLLGTTASLYTAWCSYAARHSAATSARIAKHAAKEAGEERRVASKAARLAVAASGGVDPGTAVAQERVSGEPDEPSAWKDTGRLANWHEEPSPWPREASGADDLMEVTQTYPASAHLVPDELADEYAHGLQGFPVLSAEAVARHNDEVAGVDPTESGAQSWPTASAPEDPSRSGGDSWPTEPLEIPSSGTGGGDTSSASSSGERTSAFARISLRRPTEPTGSAQRSDGG